VLLLDEPTEGIQPSIIKEMARTLKRSATARLSIVVSEQVLSFALDIADRLCSSSRTARSCATMRAQRVDAAQISKYLSV
jgi:urea transport system ATP-binding protein